MEGGPGIARKRAELLLNKLRFVSVSRRWIETYSFGEEEKKARGTYFSWRDGTWREPDNFMKPIFGTVQKEGPENGPLLNEKERFGGPT